VIDARRRRIPNAVSAAVMATGFTLAVLGASGISPASALFGLIVGFLLMLPGHTLGATGAGDVKLFAAAGTLLGAEKILPAFVWVALAGGLFAIVVAWQRGRLGRTVQFTSKLVRRPADAKPTIESPGEHNRFPYGPAIAVGCVIAALMN
jgi:prepilin peptidase CpaA